MDTAILMLITLVLGAGVGGGLLVSWGVHRRCYRLEIAVEDLKVLLLGAKRQRAADARWSKDKEAAEFLAQNLPNRKLPAGTLYDNEGFWG